MTRFVTLLAVVDIAAGLVSNEDGSSTGDARAFSPEELFLPKPNLHFDAFFVTTGGVRMTGTGGGDSEGKSPRCFDDERDVLLISRARDWEAVASVSSLSLGGKGAGAPEPLPLAPRLRLRLFDVEREYIPSPSRSSNS